MNINKLRISAIWVSHFLLWTFGDMLSLLQQINPPANDALLLFVAAPLGIFQVSMILLPLFFERRIIVISNLIMIPVYLFFNIVNFIEVSAGWEYLLTVGYIALNLAILPIIFKWKKN